MCYCFDNPEVEGLYCARTGHVGQLKRDNLKGSCVDVRQKEPIFCKSAVLDELNEVSYHVKTLMEIRESEVLKANYKEEKGDALEVEKELCLLSFSKKVYALVEYGEKLKDHIPKLYGPFRLGSTP